MARAKAFSLLGIVTGLALTPAGMAATPIVPSQISILGAASALDQNQARPPKPRTALSSAIDCYKRGDYEQASFLFQQAQSGQEDFSAAERQDLQSYVQLNATALKARHDATEQLHQAEKADRDGKMTAFADLMKKIAVNADYLAAPDKKKYQQLSDKMVAHGLGATPAANQPGMARAKIKQARAVLARGDIDAADQLAAEAAHMPVTYDLKEDTPAKVLDEIAKMRKDPKALLTAARIAMQKGDYDHAEQHALEAEKASSTWSFTFSSDSPGKVLREVKMARGSKAAPQAKPATPANQPVQTVKMDSRMDSRTEDARRLLKEGREALDRNNCEQAAKCCDQAAALNAALPSGEDRPEKLKADIQKKQTQMTASSLSKSKMSPHDMVKKGRELLKAGKYEEALAYGQKAKASNAHFGFFEDSADSLVEDIEKARQKRDQEESIKVMAEARKLYEHGDWEAASQATYRAERMHGPYSIWDMGDKPQKLRAEIETAKAKGIKAKMPAVTAMARNDKAAGPKLDVSNDDVRTYQLNQKLADARMALRVGKLDDAARLAAEAKNMNLPGKPGEDSPDKVLHEIEQARVAKSPTPYAKPGMASVGLEPSSTSKTRAQQLMAEAAQCQKQGNLVAARQKVVEAQQMKASFGPEETSPEQMLLTLASAAQHHIDSLMLEADECLKNASTNPQLYSKADKDLKVAKTTAQCYGLDTLPIDSKMGWMRQVASNNAKAPSPAAYPKTDLPAATNAQEAKGLEVLQKARLELKRGDTASARKMAIEAYQGGYGVQKQAAEVMRSIDAEEEGQRRLTACRTFDAAKAAYLRQDYVHSARIIQSVDMRLLDSGRQTRYKELINSAEMNPYMGEMNLAKGPASAIRQASGTEPAKSDSGDYQAQYSALQDVKFQQMRARGLDVQKQAADHFKNGETDRALQVLQDYLATLQTAQLDQEWIAKLRRPVESRLQQYKTLKAQRDQEKDQAVVAGKKSSDRGSIYLAEQNKEKKVAELMKEYNALYKAGKFPEAETKAMLAHELDPDNAMTGAAIKLAQLATGHDQAQKAKDSREIITRDSLNDTENQGPSLTNLQPIHIDKEFAKIGLDRAKHTLNVSLGTKRKQNELEIEHKLQGLVNLNFNETPLKTVISDLRTWQNINIVVDDKALQEAYRDLNSPITLQLENVSLRSALKLVLDKAGLVYVIEDEVLKITTEAHSRGTLKTVVYPVADLVIPIPNYDGTGGVMKAVDDSQNPQNSMSTAGGTSPYMTQFSLGGGKNVSAENGPSSSSTANGNFATGRNPAQVVKNNPKYTMEDTLMNLITNTVAPRTWDRSGGQGTIDYFPMTLALAINQTPDVQDQVAELLAALRRLQDQEVAVEVKFISIAESFYERIGVNFNVNIKTDQNTSRFESLLTSQQFKPSGFVNDFTPNGLLAGLTPAGTLTSDLDIPITASSFDKALPLFSTLFPNTVGANGGISMGLAFLSDIQVFLFMEAAQGDQRTNIMQAPKVTLFNGQTSTISVTENQTFVSNIQIFSSNGQLVFNPIGSAFSSGAILTLQATISADRRFVRLNMTPTLLGIDPIVPLFPIVTPIQVFFEGGFTGPTVNFTQFIQQPTTTNVSVQTTVAVPDGGTVLLGGLKRLSEGRNEFGPPVLSKIPYINRLFKNTGYGRETESLMIMVTPRIIINEEEETKATGVVSNPQQP